MQFPAARWWLHASARVAQAPIALLLVWVAWREPRGFDVASWHFLAHQVLLPGLALNAALATLAPTRLSSLTAALQWGASIAPALLLSTVTDVGSLRAAGILTALVALGVLAVSEWAAGEARGARRWSFGAGLWCGGLFVLSMRAPSASTQPTLRLGQASVWTSDIIQNDGDERPFDGLPLDTRGSRTLYAGPELGISLNAELRIQHAGRTLLVQPGLQIDSASAHCLWSVIDYEYEVLSPWDVTRLSERSWLLVAESRSVTSRVLVWVDHERVTLNTSNTVKREVCVHLAHVLSVALRSEGRALDHIDVASHPLHVGKPERAALAWQHGELAMLRAAENEKGPFATLAQIPDPAPVFTAAGFKFQVRGFAEQASHEASPTAGWGVSQGAIELAGHRLLWELAATSLGRGWSTVRIAPGTYELALTIEPAP